MTEADPKAVLATMLAAMLQPWHDSVADPSPAQHTVLQRLLGDYAKTEYGNLQAGENEYKVYAEDKAGNQSEPGVAKS